MSLLVCPFSVIEEDSYGRNNKNWHHDGFLDEGIKSIFCRIDYVGIF